MNCNQNNVVVVKFILVLWVLIYLIDTPNWLQTFNFMQFYRRTNFNISPIFVWFDSRLAIKLLISSISSPVLIN
jgi:hypothetical protein